MHLYGEHTGERLAEIIHMCHLAIRLIPVENRMIQLMATSLISILFEKVILPCY